MEAWRLIQKNAMKEHRANDEAFKEILRFIAMKYHCRWQRLGSAEVYDKLAAVDKAIFNVCMARLEAN